MVTRSYPDWFVHTGKRFTDLLNPYQCFNQPRPLMSLYSACETSAFNLESRRKCAIVPFGRATVQTVKATSNRDLASKASLYFYPPPPLRPKEGLYEGVGFLVHRTAVSSHTLTRITRMASHAIWNRRYIFPSQLLYKAVLAHFIRICI